MQKSNVFDFGGVVSVPLQNGHSIINFLLMMSSDLPPPSKKNWWVTPLIPYVPKPKGTPWYAVNWGLTCMCVGLPLMFSIFIASGLANGVPERSSLQRLHGKVIEVHQTAPHLIIEFANGERRSMEFPNFNTFGKQYSFVPQEYNPHLIGCRAEIRGVPMRWVLGSDRFRVYELECLDRLAAVGSLDKSAKLLASGRDSSIFISLMLWLVPVLALIYVLYRERKFYRE